MREGPRVSRVSPYHRVFICPSVYRRRRRRRRIICSVSSTNDIYYIIFLLFSFFLFHFRIYIYTYISIFTIVILYYAYSCFFSFFSRVTVDFFGRYFNPFYSSDKYIRATVSNVYKLNIKPSTDRPLYSYNRDDWRFYRMNYLNIWEREKKNKIFYHTLYTISSARAPKNEKFI